MSRYTTPSHVMLCHQMAVNVMLCHIKSNHIISYHIISWHVNKVEMASSTIHIMYVCGGCLDRTILALHSIATFHHSPNTLSYSSSLSTLFLFSLCHDCFIVFLSLSRIPFPQITSHSPPLNRFAPFQSSVSIPMTTSSPIPSLSLHPSSALLHLIHPNTLSRPTIRRLHKKTDHSISSGQ